MKTRIRNLKDIEDERLTTDWERAEGLVGDLFVWAENLKGGQNRTQEGDKEEYGEKEVKVMTERVQRALMRTKNSSTPRPDGIEYRLVKAVKITPLV